MGYKPWFISCIIALNRWFTWIWDMDKGDCHPAMGNPCTKALKWENHRTKLMIFQKTIIRG